MEKNVTIVSITDGKISETLRAPLDNLIDFEFDYVLQCKGIGEKFPRPKTVKELVNILNDRWATPFNRFDVMKFSGKKGLNLLSKTLGYHVMEK